MLPLLRRALLLLPLVLFVSCNSGTEGDIEDAQFLLDQAKYSDAITILEAIVAAEPENYEAIGLLGSAVFARGFLGEDTTYLGLFADFLEGQTSGLSNLETIQAKTPAAAVAGRNDILRAETLLADSIPDASKTNQNYLQLGFAQLAIISVILGDIGALASDDPCDYTFDAVSTADEQRFQDSLDEVNGNFESSGLEDFSQNDLGQQITQIDNDLQAAADLAAYLESEFDVSACP